MIPPAGIWLEMLRRSAASTASWFALLAFPLLMGLHHRDTSGFLHSAAGALPAAAAAFACLGWRSSRQRRDLSRLLDRTAFGAIGLSVSEIALGVILGSAAGYAYLGLFPPAGDGSVPWQAWTMPFLVSLQVSCVSTGLGHRSPSLPASILAVLGAVSMVSDPGSIPALLASPGHLSRVMGAGTANAHPDTFFAASILLSAAAVHAASRSKAGSKRRG